MPLAPVWPSWSTTRHTRSRHLVSAYEKPRNCRTSCPWCSKPTGSGPPRTPVVVGRQDVQIAGSEPPGAPWRRRPPVLAGHRGAPAEADQRDRGATCPLRDTRANLVGRQVGLARYRSSQAGQLARGAEIWPTSSVSSPPSGRAGGRGSRAASRSSRVSNLFGLIEPRVVGGLSGRFGPELERGFTFPLPKSRPPCWDVELPTRESTSPRLATRPSTPSRNGTISLHGIGGFARGHPSCTCDSPIDGFSYVYYGHAGPANELSVTTPRWARSGAGRGESASPPVLTLEIGFADSSGSPSAPTDGVDDDVAAADSSETAAAERSRFVRQEALGSEPGALLAQLVSTSMVRKVRRFESVRGSWKLLETAIFSCREQVFGQRKELMAVDCSGGRQQPGVARGEGGEDLRDGLLVLAGGVEVGAEREELVGAGDGAPAA